MERLESCHSIWVIDTDAQRFCRLPRGSRVDLASVQGKWEDYAGFEIHEDGSRVLVLNDSHTRLLRFWEHGDPCPHCAQDRTEELSVQPVEER
ncbi:MAG TPA: hypothetical protein VM618_03720 [Acidimicrobiia bacterium]|nr:hypothetical protein [Acidimicrobiia bacterium]